MAVVRPVVRDLLPGRSAQLVAARPLRHDGLAGVRPPAVHTEAVLNLAVGGHSRVEQRGEWTLRAGDLMLIPAGEAHRMLETHALEMWGLSLAVPRFAAEGLSSVLEPFERVRDGAAAVVQVPAARQEFLLGLFRELAGLDDAPGAAGFEAVQRSLLTLILAEVERAMQHTPRLPQARGGLATSALRFIERHALQPLTLHEVAAALGRSPAHLTTALTRATGRSAVQWIVGHRLAEARRLLRYTDQRVEEVAERVGYADATHFIRLFRREHGVTPAAWRVECRRDTPR